MDQITSCPRIGRMFQHGPNLFGLAHLEESHCCIRLTFSQTLFFLFDLPGGKGSVDCSFENRNRTFPISRHVHFCATENLHLPA
jgi:hypothetical protein